MAAYIVWRDDYSVGHKDIDDQHKRIIDIINAVYSLVKDGGSDETLWQKLGDLKQYTVDHFEFEEGILVRASYPDVNEHALMHAKMKSRTSAICTKTPGTPDGCVADEALSLLKDWWLNHIRGVDMQYMPYLEKLNGEK
jgi:hemerythrin-like metal-binding protein